MGIFVPKQGFSPICSQLTNRTTHAGFQYWTFLISHRHFRHSSKLDNLLYNRCNTKLSIKAGKRARIAEHDASKKYTVFMAGIQFQHGHNSLKFLKTSTFQMIARISFTNNRLNHYILLGAVREKNLPISHQRAHQNQVIY